MSFRRWLGPLALTLGVVLGGTAVPPATPAKPGSTPALVPAPALSRAAALDRYGKLPINFEPNVGQADAGIQYVARGGGYAIGLTGQSVLLGVQAKAESSVHGPRQAKTAAKNAPAQLRLSLVHAQAHPKLVAERPQPGRSNYLVGNDHSKWHTDIPNFGAVRYSDVYPGVDWVVYGNPQQLEYDLVVAPHADAGQIRLRVDGADGLRVDGNGDLVVAVQGREIRQLKPVVYQALENGERRSVDGRYKLDAGRRQVAFELGDYDHARALTIDPAVVYATYIGGSGLDDAQSVAIDSSGYVYVGGETFSTNFPYTNSVIGKGGGDAYFFAFIAKINPAGTAFVYSTVLGGTIPDDQSAPASGVSHLLIDSDGDVYAGGYTLAGDFPTVNAAQPIDNEPGNESGFLAKLNPAGDALIYSTFLGGSGQYELCGDQVNAIALDSARRLYAVGYACSSNFPLVNPLQITRGSGTILVPDGFVTELSADGGTFLFSTLLGGSNHSYGTIGTGVGVDSGGVVYAAGTTDANDFPVTANALQGANGSPSVQDAFLVKIDPVTPALLYGTYLGGSAADYVKGMALDAAGNVYLAGETHSADFPTTAGSIEPATDDADDGFVSKLAAASGGGFTLAYSTYLGGTSQDSAQSVAVDGTGAAYVTGLTYSSDFPADGTSSGDAFLSKLNPGGSALLYSIIINNDFKPTSVAMDSGGNTYVVGSATPGMQLLNPMQPTYGGGTSDAALMKLAAAQASSPAPTASASFSPTTIPLGGSATLSWSNTNTNAGGCVLKSPAQGVTKLTSLTGSITVSPTSPGTYTYIDACGSGGGHVMAAATLTVQAPPPSVTVTVNPDSIGLGSGSTLSWSTYGVDNCTASGAWTGPHLTSGSVSVSPVAQGTYTYTLTCQDSSGGSHSGSATLNVGPPSSSSSSGGASSSSSSGGSSGSSSSGGASSGSSSGAASSSSSSSGGHSSSSSSGGSSGGVTIALSPGSINLGGSSILSWSSYGVINTCNASGAWSGLVATLGSRTVSPAAQGSYVYTLSCQGSGNTYTGSAVLTVGPPSSSSSSSGGSSSSSSGGAASSSSSSSGGPSSSSSSSSSGGGGGGGGGAFGATALLPLLLGAALRRRRRYS